jgi:hypothetical protein
LCGLLCFAALRCVVPFARALDIRREATGSTSAPPHEVHQPPGRSEQSIAGWLGCGCVPAHSPAVYQATKGLLWHLKMDLYRGRHHLYSLLSAVTRLQAWPPSTRQSKLNPWWNPPVEREDAPCVLAFNRWVPSRFRFKERHWRCRGTGHTNHVHPRIDD